MWCRLDDSVGICECKLTKVDDRHMWCRLDDSMGSCECKLTKVDDRQVV